MKERELQIIVGMFSVLLLSVIGSLYYTNTQLFHLKEAHAHNLSQLEERLSNQLEKSEQALKEMNTALENELRILDKKTENMQAQQEQEVESLSNLIKQIEEQSSIELDALKSEVESINVQSQDFTPIVDEVIKSVVRVESGSQVGSGVFVEEFEGDSILVTNHHVIANQIGVENPPSLRVVTYDNDKHTPLILAYDPVSDIAVLRIEEVYDELNFGSSNKVQVGERVIAVGNPAGLSFTVTEGIVSALRMNKGVKLVQTDVPINPGSSGGPLVNIEKEVIGITTFKLSETEGLGFAVASDDVRDIVKTALQEQN